MNILVHTAANGRVIVRPDTTWEKDNEDLFVPDFVSRVSFTPVFFAHICKPGRCIGARFAGRYYDSTGYGILLYPEDMMDGCEEGFASASCLDHTSFLPYPPDMNAGMQEGDFVLLRNDDEISRAEAGTAAMVEKAITEVTRFCYIRTGDIVAVELDRRRPLCSREDGRCRIGGGQGRNKTIDFNIIF